MLRIFAIVGVITLSSTLYSQCLEGDCLNGKGVYKYRNGARYVGQFKNGRLHGIGTFHFTNGNVYTGEWVNNVRQGEGTLRSDDGVVYKGEWSDNAFEGFGILYFPDGSSFESFWKTGSSLGTGRYKMPDGTVIPGRFADGQFIPEDGQVLLADTVENNSTTEEPSITLTLSTEGNDQGWNGSESTDINANNPVNIYALIVGVSRYVHFPTLKYTDDDAYRMYAFLKSPEGGAVPDKNLRILIDEGASRKNIMKNLSEVLAMADGNDAVFVYISGHGLNGYYLPFDSDGYSGTIAYTEIRDQLDASKAKQTLCIADACYSGSMLGEKSTLGESIDQFYQKLNNAKGGLAFLLSSKPEEYSLESQGLRQGIFSHYLIQGLGGDADANSDKTITIAELYGYVRQQVVKYTGGIQTPLLAGNFDNQMPVGLLR